ncbi:NAD(P)H-dependent oxidoreductase [Natronosporangium hydrolyticum]|uniref:NAD(P)H-dependent oxidoreductase n=2 Tax=Natronosporangium hydrolyticum TaxID=2811111 RepID=A0A895YSU8_9ACTN|nr:NAD(P)H-dependent oxidoreductase [Natronosporangium hydrolyticum]
MLARHIAEGAAAHGAEVRLRTVASPDQGGGGGGLAPEPASMADLEWADAIAFGSPTRFGNLAAELKEFLDRTGPLALRGKLADKAVSGFTSAASPHGGQEATLLALYHTMCHWGAVIVPTGYTDPSLREIGGNPYGLSVTARHDGSLSPAEVVAARFFGVRLAGIGARLAEPVPEPAREPVPAGGA